MTTTALPASTERRVLRQLTRLQARRCATHPGYLVCVGLAVLTSVWTGTDGPTPVWAAEVTISIAFFIGIGGLVIAHRLTVTEERAIALLPSTPVHPTTRTLALLGACLVPLITGAVLTMAAVLVTVVWQPVADISRPAPGVVAAYGGWGFLAAEVIELGVVACFGGPALGVATARWLRFPGAGVVVACVLTITVAVFSATSWQVGVLEESWPQRLLLRASPWLSWAYDANGHPFAVRLGSPPGHLLYAVALSGLAVWAAVIKDAEGAQRVRWTRIGWTLTGLAAASYLWALLG